MGRAGDGCDLSGSGVPAGRLRHAVARLGMPAGDDGRRCDRAAQERGRAQARGGRRRHVRVKGVGEGRLVVAVAAGAARDEGQGRRRGGRGRCGARFGFRPGRAAIRQVRFGGGPAAVGKDGCGFGRRHRRTAGGPAAGLAFGAPAGPARGRPRTGPQRAGRGGEGPAGAAVQIHQEDQRTEQASSSRVSLWIHVPPGPVRRACVPEPARIMDTDGRAAQAAPQAPISRLRNMKKTAPIRHSPAHR